MSEINKDSRVKEAIAVVGAGLRLPGGAYDLDSFWRVLSEGRDCLGPIPEDRWNWKKFYNSNPKAGMLTNVKEAGFIDQDPKLFDSDFFNLSPREAAILDPQQRWLLECAWEAMEDAGFQGDAIKGSRAGVFIGGFTLDNYLLQTGVLNQDQISSHTATSSTLAMLSNRLSYTFDLRGPSLTVDTACSSSLVSTHLACQSIWNGESDWALAGGVNALTYPALFAVMSVGGFLSPDSRSKAFGSGANGYARGEGAGIVVLKPLSAALADGDRIHALIRETGCNQDGATQGIAVPNPDSQVALLRSIYGEGGTICPKSIAYIEAHGTGTAIGDPIEFAALQKVLGQRSATSFLGSVKSNIGHLEAAAGVAGILKAILALKNKQAPPSLHSATLNPAISTEHASIEVPQSLVPLQPEGDAVRACVNSFGYGGTNGHVVIERYEPEIASSEPAGRQFQLHMVPFSAKSEMALKALLSQHLELLKNGSTFLDFDDYVFNLTARRTHMEWRCAFLADNPSDLATQIAGYLAGERMDTLSAGTAYTNPKLAFVFTGMGPQWWGMGQGLYEQNAAFRAGFEECNSVFEPLSGWSLIEELLCSEADSKIHSTEVSQPMIFAIQIALTRVYESVGIRPDAVVGHSVGEIAAGFVSGLLSLEDAMTIAYHRSCLQKQTAGQNGAMCAVALSADEASELIEPFEGVSVAAVNAAESVTLSGDKSSILEIAALCDEAGVFCKTLQVEVAYHSSHMDAIEGQLKDALKLLQPHAQEPAVTVYSTVTGERFTEGHWDGEYWWRNVRQPVEFFKAASAMIEDGVTHFVQIGPHPVLAQALKEMTSSKSDECFVGHSLIRKQPEEGTFLRSLMELHCHGISPRSDAICTAGRVMDLPRYPWQHQVHWRETQRSIESKTGRSGKRIFLTEQSRGRQPDGMAPLTKEMMPWQEDHLVVGQVVFPAAGYLECMLQISEDQFESAAATIQDIQFKQMLVSDPDQTTWVKTELDAQQKTVSVSSSFNDDSSAWLEHAVAKLLPIIAPQCAPLDLEALQRSLPNSINPTEFYEVASQAGLSYGPYFQRIQELHYDEKHCLAKLVGDVDDGWLMDPFKLDAAFHSVLAPKLAQAGGGAVYLPTRVLQFDFVRSLPEVCWSYAQVKRSSGRVLEVDLQLLSESGEVLARVIGLQLTALPKASTSALPDQLLHQYNWDHCELASESGRTTPPKLLLVAACGDWELSLGEQLLEQGFSVDWLVDGDEFCIDEIITIDFSNAEHWLRFAELPLIHDVDEVIFIADRTLSGASAGDISDASMPLVHFANVVQSSDRSSALKASFVTFGTQSVLPEDRSLDLRHACWWALAPVVSNETRLLSHRLIDLPKEPDEQSIAWLIEQFLSLDTADALACRHQVRYLQTFRQKSEAFDASGSRDVDLDVARVELAIDQKGDFDTLHYQSSARRAPQGREVEIRVHYASINFKDLIKLTGDLDPRAVEGTYFESSLGLECCGTVVAVGPDVTEHKLGETKVFAARTGAFASYITEAFDYYTPHVPAGLEPFNSAVLVPGMTVLQALENIARLKAGERVLIHSATGAVGLVAIQYAQSIGAVIYATAGTDSKRQLLKDLGVQHVFHSRTLDFVEGIRHATDGRGIDVVLNANPGEIMLQSLRLLVPHGRFVEIGKLDMMRNTALPMEVFNKSISYTAFDLDRLLANDPEASRSLIRRYVDGHSDGTFRALPTICFHARDIRQAFDTMRRSEHVGKLSVDFSEGTVAAIRKPLEKKVARGDGTYLVTGGTSGLGLEIALWLAQKGAGHIALTSRSGGEDAVVAPYLERIASAGAQVEIIRCDIADSEAVADMISAICAGGLPLRGVFHGAMVLDDGMLCDMTEARFHRVLAPKIDGVWNLHRSTQDCDLDYFVCLSSVSSIIGNPGQANYVAANAFLDGFSAYRRSQGLHGLTINLGVVADVGVLSRDADAIVDSFREFGIEPMVPTKILGAIERALLADCIQTAVIDVDWSRLFKRFSKLGSSSRFEHFVAASEAEVEASPKSTFIQTLESLPVDEHLEHCIATLHRVVANTLRTDPDQLDDKARVNNLGIDSLLSLELEQQVFNETGLQLKSVDFLSGNSIRQLGEKLYAQAIPQA